MQLIKVGAAVLNQTPLDWENNRRNIIESIHLAKSAGVSVLCLPELCVTGYGCEDAFYSMAVQRSAIASLLQIVPETKGIIACVGIPLAYQNALFNCACLLVDGQIAGFVAKRFLAGDGIYYEPRWFKAWPEDLVVETELQGKKYPLGDLHFDCGGIRIGFEICEDAWVAKRPGSELSLQGVDIILNPSASHFAFGKFEVRKRFVLEGSRAFGLSYVYSNHLGNEAGRAVYDGGALIASGGKLLAAGPRFSYQPHVLTSSVIDVDQTRAQQSRSGSFSPQLDGVKRERIVVPFQYPADVIAKTAAKIGDWETSDQIKEEEFCRAVSLGLADYLRKSHCKGFVVSLSGGADSATVSLLVWLMVEFGVKELGLEFFAKRLGREDLAKLKSPKEIVSKILSCIYQSTGNSSETTRSAAEKLAKSIHAEFLQFDVGALVDSYVKLAAHELGRELTWEKDDLALQNIQARVRSPGAWLVANVKNALLLVTSNRSEAAVGYATMDGDTSGALSPIGGIDKAFILNWLRWLEIAGPAEVGAQPILKVITDQKPTAELRPSARQQTDESDLMPYEILDVIERAAILDRHSPIEIFQRMHAQYPQLPATQLAEWIEKFFTLWCRNQWKRERFAPAFHLDDESLDPKTWCRFPILSGGYRTEIEELRRYVAERKKK